MGRRQRLDLLLVELGLAVSRQQAQQLIRAGRVRAGDRLLDKPGTEVDPALALQVEQPPRFVSRGGEKLVAALEALPIQVAGRICLDAGISTGGFSDCLLQHGASRIYGIDVGYGQTAWSLRSDARLRLRERCNIRHLTAADLYGPEDPWPDLAVADLSFISLTRVLPALKALLRHRDSPGQRDGGQPEGRDSHPDGDAAPVDRTGPVAPSVGGVDRHEPPSEEDQPGADRRADRRANLRGGEHAAGDQRSGAPGDGSAFGQALPLGAPAPSAPTDLLDLHGPEAVLLVKPQFEVGPSRVGKGGVVRDPSAHADAIATVLAAAADLNWPAAGLLASPITGPAGNHEYLLWLSPRLPTLDLGRPAIEALVAATLRSS